MKPDAAIHACPRSIHRDVQYKSGVESMNARDFFPGQLMQYADCDASSPDQLFFISPSPISGG